MSLKKTWFSYVLWVIFTVLTGAVTYVATTKMFAVLPVFALFGTAGVIAVCFFVHYICCKIKPPVVSKWTGRVLHILMFLIIAAAFVVLRLPAFMNLSVAELTEQAAGFYKASMVGAQTADVPGVASLFEQTYINVLSGLFLFLGNKAEILYYFQMFLQSVSFLLLLVIGWTFQKRVYAWIPALFYAVSPFLFSAVRDVGPANFWLCIMLIGVSVICLLEKAWKNRNITYVVLTAAELLFGAFIFIIKADVILYGNNAFTSGGIIKGTTHMLGMELLIIAILMVFYCVSFWFNKQDHKALYVLPFTGYCVLFVCLSFYEFDSAYFCVMSAVLNLYFLIAESMRVMFTFKPEVVTGSIPMDKQDMLTVNKDSSDFDWSEMNEIMKGKSVEEKASVMEEIKEEAAAVKEETPVVDKTAPIENVLPMPKKHMPKVLGYAFEPEEDMMHYDVEIENDEYDYS